MITYSNMPKIATYKFLTFFIFASDALNEMPHLHIAKEKGNRQRSAKIWLTTIEISDRGTLSDPDLNQAIKIIMTTSLKNKPMSIEKVLFNLPGKNVR